MVDTVITIVILIFVLALVCLELYQIEKKNTIICKQEFEIKNIKQESLDKDSKLREITEEYTILYNEYEKYKQLNPDSKAPRPTTPYDIVNEILGGKDEVE